MSLDKVFIGRISTLQYDYGTLSFGLVKLSAKYSKACLLGWTGRIIMTSAICVLVVDTCEWTVVL